MMAELKKSSGGIHPSAIVEDGASIETRVREEIQQVVVEIGKEK